MAVVQSSLTPIRDCEGFRSLDQKIGAQVEESVELEKFTDEIVIASYRVS